MLWARSFVAMFGSTRAGGWPRPPQRTGGGLRSRSFGAVAPESTHCPVHLSAHFYAGVKNRRAPGTSLQYFPAALRSSCISNSAVKNREASRGLLRGKRRIRSSALVTGETQGTDSHSVRVQAAPPSGRLGFGGSSAGTSTSPNKVTSLHEG